MRRFKALWLLITFLSVVVLPAWYGWYVRENRNQELSSDLTAQAMTLEQENNLDGALAVCDFLISHDLDETGSATVMRETLIEKKYSVTRKATDGIWGFVSGDISNPSSMVGCIAGDLTAFGDVRDLARNALRKATGGEVDTLNVALSAVGLATTLAPHLDVGISVAKNCAKVMSSGLRKTLLILAEEAVKLKKYDKLAGFVSDLGILYNKLGTGALTIIKMAEDSRHLGQLTRLLEATGKTGYAFITVGGKSALSFLGTATDMGAKLTGTAGKRVLSFALRYPQLGARILKIGKKVGVDHFDVTAMLVSDILGSVPLAWIAGAGLALWLWMYLADAAALLLGLVFRKPAVAAISAAS